MFLTVHASVGAVIGEYTGLPAPSFLLGVLSHFMLDAIPHGDEGVGRIFVVERLRAGWLGAVFFLDALTAFSVLTLLWMSGAVTSPVAAYSGALGAVLPDVLSGFTAASRGLLWPRFTAFHDASHRYFRHEVAAGTGYVIQIGTFVAVWVLAAPAVRALFFR